jgi:hypothetical protein
MGARQPIAHLNADPACDGSECRLRSEHPSTLDETGCTVTLPSICAHREEIQERCDEGEQRDRRGHRVETGAQLISGIEKLANVKVAEVTEDKERTLIDAFKEFAKNVPV